MSWRDAPLYVEAYSIATELCERALRSAGIEARLIALPLASRASALLDAVAIALTFPAGRAQALRHADECIVRLRMSLRLAGHCGWLSPGAARSLHERLDTCGRMVGGWRRRPATAKERDPPKPAE